MAIVVRSMWPVHSGLEQLKVARLSPASRSPLLEMPLKPRNIASVMKPNGQTWWRQSGNCSPSLKWSNPTAL